MGDVRVVLCDGSAVEVDADVKAEIDAMTREQMARLWRFAPSGHRLFQGDVGAYFKERFYVVLGGFTPELSKRIRWEP